MRYLKAILSTLLMSLAQVLFPIFYQWYEQRTGINAVGIGLFFFLISCGALALCIALWVSAIRDKDLKDL